MNASELEGAELDAAVARLEGLPVHPGRRDFMPRDTIDTRYADEFRPSTDWRDGGPIIERERLVIGPEDAQTWVAYADGATIEQSGSDTITGSNVYGVGATPLIAAMRAYVAASETKKAPGPKAEG